MAFDLRLTPDVPCTAENDLSSSQFHAVEISGASLQVDVCDNAGDVVFGILQNKPTAGVGAAVRTMGITMWTSDGSGTAITAGSLVGTNAVGRAVVKAVAGDRVRGIALDASSANGTVIPVYLIDTMIPA